MPQSLSNRMDVFGEGRSMRGFLMFAVLVSGAAIAQQTQPTQPQKQEPQKFTLRFKLSNGQTLRYKFNADIKAETKTPQGAGGPPEVRMGMVLALKVGAAQDDGLHPVTVTLEDAELSVKVPGSDSEKKLDKRLALSVFRQFVERSNMHVGNRYAELPFPVGISGTLFVPVVLPKEAVAVGKEWTDESAVAVQGYRIRTVFKYKLAEVKGKLATIEVHLKNMKVERQDMTKPQPKIEEVGGTGKVLLDTEAGKIVSAEYKMIILTRHPTTNARTKASLKGFAKLLPRKQKNTHKTQSPPDKNATSKEPSKQNRDKER